MVYKSCLMAGLVFGFSLHSMDKDLHQVCSLEWLEAKHNKISVISYVAHYRPYSELHNELIDICRTPLVSFNQEVQKRFDFLIEYPDINVNYIDSRRELSKQDVTLLGAACSTANHYTIASLLKKGANPNLPTAIYTLPVLAVAGSPAAIDAQIACLNLLKSYGADFYGPISGNDSDTPLHRAAANYPHIVPYLLTNNDRTVNCLGNCGKTPLISAIDFFGNNQHTEAAVKALITHKADIHAKDRLGHSVWYYAEDYDGQCNALAHNIRRYAFKQTINCSPTMVQLLLDTPSQCDK